MSETGRDAVAIIGSGGIGGYLAGELVTAGRDVTLCVRTPFDRLTIESGGTTRDVEVRLATDPGEVRPVRWILLTTKAQDTAGAQPWLEALTGPGTTLVVVQNGVDHVERAGPVAGSARIVPAIIYCSVERDRPGHVVHHGAARMIVPTSEASAGFAQLFAGTAFEIVEEQDFVTAAWRKLCNNLVGNAITALTLRRGIVFQEAAVLDLAREILLEALAVSRAEGARLTRTEIDQSHAGLGRFGPEAGTSMLYDRLAGRPLEHEALTGALVRAADRHGIPVPVNRTLLALLGAVSGQKLRAVR
ncbi:2-dehydropantoate 2-reductase [uncultured Enterovirga sp.]|uniref:2-dehydropantoate 2-reductase n=1 Tax=uncultured Enterovirga sp. TaxID=2026352 RepID=UPI0035CBB7DA